ncbi:MAG TPA: hypothetical protein VJM33_15505, partial [Microthrixaceae bacterium]|nr:hypothetical protein [Microthrixaceae bacterium]
FDVGLSTGAAPPAAASGNDLLEGDGGDDVIFGQGVGDRIHGDDGPSTAGDGAAAGADYVEGNDGDDTIFGEAENDDLIGGGSANDGIIDALRVGNTLRDVGEALISGGSGNDWITGDNGIVDRNLPSDAPAPIVLFDVELVSAAPVSTLVSGGDLAEGGTGDDRIFGQGNGAQNLSDERDPRDESPAGPGEDNDLDGTTDENWAYASPKGLPAWNGDTLLGNEGADEMEGNHGNDLLLGGDGEDDMLGGGSADDGQIDSDRLNDGANLRDAHDVLHGEGEDDVQAGDNAEIRHDNAVVGRAGFRFVGGESDYDLAERVVEMTASPPGASFGNDFITGNLGDDEQYGQAGNDMMRGDRGDDVQLGDLGQVRTDLIGDGVNELVTSTNFDQAIRPNEPFIDDVRWKTGMLFREARLLSADDTKPGFVGGDDFIVGSDGRDSIHAGPGSDLVAGDGDAPLGSESLHWDPDLEAQGEVTVITDPFDEVIGGETFDGESIDAKVDDGDDEDHIFGGDGADAMWGGRDHDHQYGGHGTDYVDVRPGTNVASGAPIRPHFAFWSRFAGIENYHGHDHLHGGWGQDALQANIAENGPIEGDRLIDAVGAYNVYYLCPATYGDYVSTRDISPSLNGYIQNQAEGDGGYQVKTTGTNGFRELAIVFPSDAKNNSKPVHPDTPGHFVCQSTP